MSTQYIHLVLLLLFFQGKTPDLTAPHNTTLIQNPKSLPEVEKSFIPTATSPAQKATPGLSENSAFTSHEMIEHELGGEEEAVGELKSKVVALEDHREKYDRPDIDDLKETRTHLYMWATTVGAVLALMGIFRKVLWEDVLRKRVIAFIAGTSPPAPPPPPSTPPSAP
jgi:hypothetical protein